MPDISAISNETVWQRFRYVHPIDGSIDVTGFDVELAIVVLGDEPAATDWFVAAWEPTEDADGYYLATMEIGPGAGTVELTAGLIYSAWLRLTLPSETPIVRGPDEINAY